MEGLKNIVTEGLVKDVFQSEQSLNVYNFIAKNAKLINSKKENIAKSFGYLQHLSKIEFVLALARIFDKSSLRNKTRCFESALEFITTNHETLKPNIDTGFIKDIIDLGIPQNILQSLEDENYSCFNLMLTQFFKKKVSENSKKIQIIKTWRDKLIAHNEDYNKVVSIKHEEISDLYVLIWNFISIVGIIYLNEHYYLNGRILMREQTNYRTSDIKKLIETI